MERRECTGGRNSSNNLQHARPLSSRNSVRLQRQPSPALHRGQNTGGFLDVRSLYPQGRRQSRSVQAAALPRPQPTADGPGAEMQGWVLGWMGKRRNAFSNPALMVGPGLEVLYLGFLRRGLSTARRGMDGMDALLWLN